LSLFFPLPFHAPPFFLCFQEVLFPCGKRVFMTRVRPVSKAPLSSRDSGSVGVWFSLLSRVCLSPPSWGTSLPPPPNVPPSAFPPTLFKKKFGGFSYWHRRGFPLPPKNCFSFWGGGVGACGLSPLPRGTPFSIRYNFRPV